VQEVFIPHDIGIVYNLALLEQEGREGHRHLRFKPANMICQHIGVDHRPELTIVLEGLKEQNEDKFFMSLRLNKTDFGMTWNSDTLK
jgi:hypothetical protein